jgi:cytochrome c oxidase assembly protein subunit 15
MVVTMVVLLRRSGLPVEVRRRAEVVLGVILAQATVGYLQYFNGVPVVLVGIHIAGAATLWATVLRFHLGLREGPVSETAATGHRSRVLAGV